MYTIQTLNKISPIGLDRLDQNKFVVGDEMENPDGIIVRSAAMHDMEFGKKLKAIARAGAGVNNIPVDACTEQGIVVFNTPGGNANAVKEMVLAALLMSSRKLPASLDWVKTIQDEGDEVPKLVEKGKSQFVGPEIAGKKLGIIGLGAVGVRVANAATHLDMQVLGYDPYISVDAAWGLSRNVVHATSLKEIFEQCDYITIHVPQNQNTKGMINSESIAMMKQGVRILNFARGGLVVDEDIIAALGTGKVGVYVTDFPNKDLIGVPGVIAFPHLGASTPESEDNCAKMAAEQLADFLENGNIINSVNLPNASIERSGEERICVIHKNIPTMITQITTIVSNAGLNIENLLNKSKKDYAYTIIDVCGEVEKDQMAQLKAIDGVIRVNLYR